MVIEFNNMEEIKKIFDEYVIYDGEVIKIMLCIDEEKFLAN